jgi:hypothetical protein
VDGLCAGELARPFLQAWDWIGQNDAFAGKGLAVGIVVVAAIGLLTWLSKQQVTRRG